MRNYSSPSYRYGFQGQEKDDEIKGNGNSLNYTFRMHDPRVGRFFAVDPLTAKYPHYTPYSFSGNKVIAFAELEGLEETIMIYMGNDKYKSISKSQFTASKWFEIKNSFQYQAISLFKNGQAVVYGKEKYFVKNEEGVETRISAPENGILYYDLSKGYPEFTFDDTKQNLTYSHDDVMKEAILRYNPLGPLLHPIFSNQELDSRDKAFQDNVKETWKAVGSVITLGYSRASLAGDLVTAKKWSDIAKSYGKLKLGLELATDGAKKDWKSFIVDLSSFGLKKLISKKVFDKIDNQAEKAIYKLILKIQMKYSKKVMKHTMKKDEQK